MSRLLCIIDGMTDASFSVADYPLLAAMRSPAQVQTTPRGQKTESLTCILALLGVSTPPPFLRGYVEALGAGIDVDRDDLILRISWLALQEGRYGAPVAAPSALRHSCAARYHCLGGYQGLLILPGAAAMLEQIRVRPFFSKGSNKTADLRPQGLPLLAQIFDQNCADGICPAFWGQSRPVSLPPFPGRAAVVCGSGVMRGIARLLAMQLLPVPGATGDVDTNLAAKLATAQAAAEEYPFIVLHINGADEASHRRDAVAKHRFLTRVEQQVLRPLCNSRHTLYVIADHATEPSNGRHRGGPQPLFYHAMGK